MAKLISKTYGDALFELALEDNKLDVFLEESKALTGILKENEELSSLMNHPKIRKEDKLSVLEQVFGGRISDEMKNFLVIIIKKDRYSEILSILDYIISCIMEEKKIGKATVVTAFTLNMIQKKHVEDKLLATTHYVKMEVDYQVDKALIGGMVIRIGDRVVDTSVQTKLDNLSKELYKIQLA